jgi:radical SAM-linked protein
VPLEFTQGLKPHLRLAFSPPLGIGVTSRCELLDFGAAGEWNSSLTAALQKALPPGLIVENVFEKPQGQPRLGSLNVFLYKAWLKQGISMKAQRAKIKALAEADSIPILRLSPKGVRAFDARSNIWKLEWEEDSLQVGIKTLGGPAPRVIDILKTVVEDPKSEGSRNAIIASWQIERQNMWWEVDRNWISPVNAEAERIKTKR